MANIDKVLTRIPDDIIEYSVFPVIPTDFNDTELENFLQEQIDMIISHFSDLLVNHIWQHQSFHLKPILASKGIPPHLHGSTCFGDNVDDEWFIVSLLYDITREFSGCVVRVNDNDEEFLLIEAADALPKWLNPESAENRVFIYNGDLHVVPVPELPEEYNKFPMFTPSLEEAVCCVRDCSRLTRSSQNVQNLINKRLACFPAKCTESIHHTNCIIPTPLAVLLDAYPSLISLGVRRFYYRDPLELKACRPMRRFKPDDLTRTRVKMTRCMYAQLVQQKFAPDRRSGWPVVAPSNTEFLERDIGMKLAHGFEILCSKCKNDQDGEIDGVNLDSSNIQWQRFRQALSNKGYFKGEIDGSKMYTKLLNEAKQYFFSHVSTLDENPVDEGQMVLHRLKELERSYDDFRSEKRYLPPSDDDSWINITPEQLDEMMKSASGFKGEGSGEPFDLSKIAQSMSSFVEHESGIEGAEFPRESTGNGGSGMIQAMQELFDFSDDDESTGSGMSEYDWSGESEDDELGSHSEMPQRKKKSSLRNPPSKNDRTPNGNDTKIRQTKSVRFSGSEHASSVMSERGVPSTLSENKTETSSKKPQVPPRPIDSKATPQVPPRPSKIIKQKTPLSPQQSSMSKQTPPVPARPPPPPVPNRPPARKEKEQEVPLKKPNAPKPAPTTQTGKSNGKRDRKLEALMDAMDRELASTDVGKSFERVPRKSKPRRPGKTSVSSNGATPSCTEDASEAASRDIEDEDDDFRPVNIDVNVVKNTLESYKAQQGLPGPASNILSGFGLYLPDDDGSTRV